MVGENCCGKEAVLWKVVVSSGVSIPTGRKLPWWIASGVSDPRGHSQLGHVPERKDAHTEVSGHVSYRGVRREFSWAETLYRARVLMCHGRWSRKPHKSVTHVQKLCDKIPVSMRTARVHFHRTAETRELACRVSVSGDTSSGSSPNSVGVAPVRVRVCSVVAVGYKYTLRSSVSASPPNWSVQSSWAIWCSLALVCHVEHVNHLSNWVVNLLSLLSDGKPSSRYRNKSSNHTDREDAWGVRWSVRGGWGCILRGEECGDVKMKI